MNFFRDEKGAREVLGDWMTDTNMYYWDILEAQMVASKIFEI